MSTTPLLRRLALLAVPALLAACGSSSGPAQPPPCPHVAILQDAADLARFQPGGGTDITDMVIEARMIGVAGGCQARRGGAVDVVIRIGIEATRGPRASTRAEQLPYFIAVTDAQGRVVDKAEFAVSIEFPANISRRRGSDEQRIVIPSGMNPADLRVDIGFQLTPDQVALNRRRAVR